MADYVDDINFPPYFNLTRTTTTHFIGWIKHHDQLDGLLKYFEKSTANKFVSWSDDKKTKERTVSTRRCVWRSEFIKHSSRPFSVVNTVVLACCYGKRHRRKEKIGNQSESRRKCTSITSSRKVDCPAKIFIKKMLFYDEYDLTEQASRRHKQQILKGLILDHRGDREMVTSSVTYVQLPRASAHKNHNCVGGASETHDGIVGNSSCMNDVLNPLQHSLGFVTEKPNNKLGSYINDEASTTLNSAPSETLNNGAMFGPHTGRDCEPNNTNELATIKNTIVESLNIVHELSSVCTDVEIMNRSLCSLNEICVTLRESIAKNGVT